MQSCSVQINNPGKSLDLDTRTSLIGFGDSRLIDNCHIMVYSLEKNRENSTSTELCVILILCCQRGNIRSVCERLLWASRGASWSAEWLIPHKTDNMWSLDSTQLMWLDSSLFFCCLQTVSSCAARLPWSPDLKPRIRSSLFLTFKKRTLCDVYRDLPA